MPVVIIALYLLRTAVNNSGYPIQKAILMDYVPKASQFYFLKPNNLADFYSRMQDIQIMYKAIEKDKLRLQIWAGEWVSFNKNLTI